LLNNSEISHVDKRTIGTIARNSVNLSKLTRQIIETTKNDNWQLKLDIKKFYLYEIINPIINEYTVLAKEKDIQLDFSLNNLQEVFLTSDSNKLQVIIMTPYL
jgi:signal transduction histidine kinase